MTSIIFAFQILEKAIIDDIDDCGVEIMTKKESNFTAKFFTGANYAFKARFKMRTIAAAAAVYTVHSEMQFIICLYAELIGGKMIQIYIECDKKMTFCLLKNLFC